MDIKCFEPNRKLKTPEGIERTFIPYTLGEQNSEGISTPLEYRSIDTVRCSYCNAEPGYYCTMPNGTMRPRIHDVRKRQWHFERLSGEWIGELLVSNPKLGLNQGDLVVLKGFYKGSVEILRRLSDGHDPEAWIFPTSTRFVRETTKAERRVSAKRVLSEETQEDRRISAMQRRALARTLSSMA